MRKLIFGSLMFFAVCLLLGSELKASSLPGTPLLAINGQEYSKEDFLNWWGHWSYESEFDLSDQSLDDYVDFKIMVQQALAMEYDKNPTYLQKIGVYLKVRSLIFLQNEEINSKINITEDDIRRSFNERFAPIWDLQILTFKKLAEAEAAYRKIQPFAGKVTGQLIFADLQGDGEAVYEEAKVSPEAILKAKRSEWLEIIRPLQEGYVSKPQAVGDHGQFVLFRLKGIGQPQEEAYEKKKARVKHDLYKKLRGVLTADLLEKLKKKFHLSVDEKLLGEIDIEQKYPADFLARAIVSIDGLDVSVGQFIRNVRRDKSRRPGMDQAFVKNNMINTIVNQVLIDKEALDRHYELSDDQLKNTWAFYTQNRLRITLEAQLKKSIEISDDELNSFYEDNQEDFSVPGKLSYILIKSAKGTIQKIWAGQLQGQDIMDSARKHGAEAKVMTGSEDSLDEVLRGVLAVTQKGETSSPFQYQGSEAIVKILGKVPGEKQTLDSVRNEIKGKIIESRFKKNKEVYVSELRQRSEVTVNKKVWKEIQEKKN